ncbi:MAG: sugar phosphate isomerase/epimerase family protein [Tepidisphaeraceae bacterium]
MATVARVLGEDLRECVKRSRALGFEGLCVDAITRSLDLTTLSATGFRDVRHVFSGQDQALVALRAETGPDGLGPGSDTDRVLDRADGVLRAAAALGVTTVCLDLGRLPPAPRVTKPKPAVTPQMAGLLILPEPVAAPEPIEEPVPTIVDPAVTSHWTQAMAHLGEIADRYGVMLALSSTLSSFAPLQQILEQVRCPWFGVDLDTAGLLKDRWSLDETFDAFGPLIRHVRARDAVKGEGQRTKPAIVGRGDLPWRSVLQMLDAAGYHAAVTIDPTELADPPAAAASGLKQLKAFLESA